MNKIKRIALLLALITSVAFAGNDPTIKGKERSSVATVMKTHIDLHNVGGKYLIYDQTSNKMRSLTFASLHSGIVKKGKFYVSCADFLDDEGKRFDLDFLIIKNGKNYKFVQALVHKVNDEKRPYTIE